MDAVKNIAEVAEKSGASVTLYAALSMFVGKYHGKDPQIGEWDAEVRNNAKVLLDEIINQIELSRNNRLSNG